METDIQIKNTRQLKLMLVVNCLTAICLVQQFMQITAIPLNQITVSTPEFRSLATVTVMFITISYLLIKSLQNIRSTIQLAFIDDLTGLPNRRSFETQLYQDIQRNNINDSKLSVVYFDLDKFKNINDGYGHDAGDFVIMEFGKRLKSIIRDGDTIARLSGDEFAAIVFDHNGLSPVEKIAERVFECMNEPIIFDGKKIHAGVSIGAYNIRKTDRDHLQVLRLADYALMQAKESGRNTFRLFDPCMADKLEIRGQLESELRETIQKGGLSVKYQPLVASDNEEIIGVEALARWEHSIYGAIPPSEFVKIAEEIGLADRLGDFVLRKACKEISGHPSLNLSVNISPLHFIQKGFVESVKSILQETGFDPAKLELEITEGVFMSEPSRTKKIILKLQKLGVQISLDDFGTGFSSMSYLRDMPVNRIKIDKSFLSDSDDSASSRSMISTMIQLGRSLSLSVTVEGVESLKQLNFLSV